MGGLIGERVQPGRGELGDLLRGGNGSKSIPSSSNPYLLKVWIGPVEFFGPREVFLSSLGPFDFGLDFEECSLVGGDEERESIPDRPEEPASAAPADS